MKLKIHPAFFAYALLLVLGGLWLPLLISFLCVLLHEGAHARAAAKRGYRLNQVTLMPYGAVLEGGENLKREDAIPIAAAGPACNFILASGCMALWWCFPATYPYTHLFFRINLALGLFNLLPAYPLDGARIVVALSKHPLKALRALRWVGIALGAAFFALFLVSAFFKIQYSAGVLGVMLFLSATEGTKSERYYHLASGIFEKDRTHPLPLHEYTVDGGVPLSRILKTMRTDRLCRYRVKTPQGERTMSEQEMAELCIRYPLRYTVAQCYGAPLPHPHILQLPRPTGKHSGLLRKKRTSYKKDKKGKKSPFSRRRTSL